MTQQPDSTSPAKAKPTKLSIIIPTLNEAGNLPRLLESLAPLRRCGTELIVVDGGSEDDTIAAATRAGVRWMTSPRGRARQMNVGALATTGEVLLFLHADTRLPPFAEQSIATALADGRLCWGRFDVCISGSAFMLKIVACLMNLRSRISGIATGDQAIFVTREAFEAIGHFPEQPLMEDIELSRRLLACSRPACLHERVVTSGRRWEQRGVLRTIVLMWQLRWAYWRGASAAQLAERYR